ncbi:MAG TPA: MBL fold metallo-hydrolase [Anaerolineae bacterium]|nr:MBL fold metallo-hydrolase [Anaerolineae bacterium]
MLELKVHPVGEYQSNCYLLVAPKTHQGILIDAGDGAEEILRFVGSLEIVQILITHGHVDHVSALEIVREAFGAPVGIHPADVDVFGLRADFLLQDGDTVDFVDEELRVSHVPGHTPGSVIFGLIERGDIRRAIVGDAIFPGGPGHTETPQALVTSLDSLARTVFTWGDEVILYPGHGDPTTVGEERAAFEAFRAGSIPPDLCGDVAWC